MKHFMRRLGLINTPVKKASLEERSKNLKSIDSSFDGELTKSLKFEHLAIDQQFNKILRSFRMGEYDSTREQIRLIVNSYFIHSTRKQSRVYTFLEKCFSTNRGFIDHMKRYRKKLGRCNNDLLSFFNCWTLKDIATGGVQFEHDLVKAKESFNNWHLEEIEFIYKFYDDHARFLSNQSSLPLEKLQAIDENISELSIYSSEEDSEEAIAL